ncbi:MAG: hypothetical protein JRJ38_17965 [Deltaproteobacteria bacterium]|nr:hypothetical protein [Deltaproteobacteria bacterium]
MPEPAKTPRGPVLPQIIAIGLLLWALVPSNPYGYYILLRWVCCPIFAYLAFRAYKIEKMPWVWILGVAAFVYNPAVRVYLTREIWSVVNVVTIAMLAPTFVVLRAKAEPDINRRKTNKPQYVEQSWDDNSQDVGKPQNSDGVGLNINTFNVDTFQEEGITSRIKSTQRIKVICKKCGTCYSVTLRRAEAHVICPKCHSLENEEIDWG